MLGDAGLDPQFAYRNNCTFNESMMPVYCVFKERGPMKDNCHVMVIVKAGNNKHEGYMLCLIFILQKFKFFLARIQHGGQLSQTSCLEH